MGHLFKFEGWEIVEKLGEGGMCAVFRVRSEADPSVERAVKVMTEHDNGAAERFAAEARLLISLEHPNVLKVFELVEDDPHWIIMELLAGRDLEEHRDTVDLLGPDQVASWFADLAQGLQKVHDLGVVHRDIKPSNIMIGTDGVPRLIDFGVARDTTAARITKTGIVVGTASYLPPELFMQSDPQALQDDPAADVYALGQTLCEMLINRPIHDPNEFHGPKLLVMIMQDKISRPYLDPREWDKNIPVGLAQIVIDATAQMPEERIQTARELERRLRVWLEARREVETAPVSRTADLGALPPPPTGAQMLPGPPAAPKRRRSGWMSGLLGMGALGVIGVGVAALLVIGLGGVGLLVAFAPDGAERSVSTSLETDLAADALGIHACVPSGAKQLDLRIATAGGAVRAVDVVGLEDAGAKECVARRVSSWAVPDVGREVTVTIPVRFQ